MIKTHFLSYLAQYNLELEMFQTKVVEKIKTQIFILTNVFFFKNRTIQEIMWKNIYIVEGGPATGVNTVPARCMLGT